MAARVNSLGTKVSLSVAQSSLLPDPKLYIWDVETDSLSYFNFASGKTMFENRPALYFCNQYTYKTLITLIVCMFVCLYV